MSLGRWVAAFWLCAVGATACAQAKPHVLMLSIDGMRPDYVTHAAEHGLRLPTLSGFLKDGAYAEGVIGVVPTVTYPSHITLISGVWPSEHGIYDNSVFDPMRERGGESNWWYSAVRAETLLEAAHRGGLTTGAVGWPVTVGAPVDYLLAVRGKAMGAYKAGTPEDALERPAGLADSLNVVLPTGTTDDEARVARSIAIVQKYRPNLMLVHLNRLDSQQHLHGPFSPEADAELEHLDGMAARLIAAERAADADSKIVVVSDHGFAVFDHTINLNVLLASAGLITLTPEGTVTGWEAQAWSADGTAAIMLREPGNQVVLARVKTVLDKAAANSAYGINRILSHDELVRMGGFPDASFLVDFKPGWAAGGALRGEVVRENAAHGTHGYLPEHVELRSAFMVEGAGVARGKNLGVIDMRQIAPSVAQMLHIRLPAAKLKSVAYAR